ncbi:1-aminocyclopropane-1-carboxylate oxidase [Grifola frondosa]|uniref:1-aminocyclopropane-1-carboxylate oxidase n=1 Tax=Grifola frondosa TaxID=5627 RepID=A0A1C7LN97_GRIFR|nr:1-aminocyclopropane-1-carboxylate oxidase [Grifola frondosa]
MLAYSPYVQLLTNSGCFERLIEAVSISDSHNEPDIKVLLEHFYRHVFYRESPPFPEDVPTHPLLVVDYELLKVNDEDEIAKLWKAATELGFWYLKNHGADEEVKKMFDMGAETMALPFEEKMKFEQGDDGMSCGYKAAGANATDETGALDTVEFINVSKDDALGWPKPVHRVYPSTVNARMESTIIPFIRKSIDVNTTLLEIFNGLLGLPRNPPRPEGISEKKAALGAHTDFGSLSFLHNRLGGLQVMVPGTDKWQYVKPISGHAICNLGDAMTIFSGGILKSNLHRVVPPPGAQSQYERWSLVYFTRPGNTVILNALTEDSPMIADAIIKAADAGIFNSGQTASEWFARRTKNQRAKNQKGAETWRASRGTEHRASAA